MLLAVLVDGEALKVDHATGTELRLDRPRDVDGRFESAQLGHAVLDHLELDRNDARHLDGPAEGDFPVALCKLGVSSVPHPAPPFADAVGLRHETSWSLVDERGVRGAESVRGEKEKGARHIREKCRSPTENLAPGTWTGR